MTNCRKMIWLFIQRVTAWSCQAPLGSCRRWYHQCSSHCSSSQPCGSNSLPVLSPFPPKPFPPLWTLGTRPCRGSEPHPLLWLAEWRAERSSPTNRCCSCSERRLRLGTAQYTTVYTLPLTQNAGWTFPTGSAWPSRIRWCSWWWRAVWMTPLSFHSWQQRLGRHLRSTLPKLYCHSIWKAEYVYLYIFDWFKFFIPCGKFGSPYLDKATAAAKAALSIPTSSWISNWISTSCQPHRVTWGWSNSVVSKWTLQNSSPM